MFAICPKVYFTFVEAIRMFVWHVRDCEIIFVSMMRLLYGLLIFVCAGFYVCGANNTTEAYGNNKNEKNANKPNNDPKKPVSEKKN